MSVRRTEEINATLQQALFPYERPAAASAPEGVREKNGVVYTKRWVVDLILDSAGYLASEPLNEKLLIEPSAGDGSFLLGAVDRLVESCRIHGVSVCEARSSIAAFELDPQSVENARGAVYSRLLELGVADDESERLATSWVRCADYLLETGDYVARADFVVGNPPYIRLEDLDNGGALYRSSYPTMVGRADIYVAFYEAALRHLKPGGVCGFICADRWMFNQYGAALRAFVTKNFSVDTVVSMHHADAFESEVSAYPAVTMIRRGAQGPVVVSSLEPDAERIGGSGLSAIFERVRATGVAESREGVAASRVDSWFVGDEPWPLMEPGKMALLKRLEREFPTLEATGTTVGIGVATGADKVFITKDDSLVEKERLLPLAMAFDVKGSELVWSKHYLVNPWNGKGLVDLGKYPRLAEFFDAHREKLSGRHVGKKAPANWYRTIDRVNAELTARPKLYLPDFKGRIAPVLDRGETYPHHNLYFIVSDEWDLEVLGGLLLCDVAQFFVEAYGVRMRGGYLRFQAQYVRRIRVPHPKDIPATLAKKLKTAFATHDVALANSVAGKLYRLSEMEGELFGRR